MPFRTLLTAATVAAAAAAALTGSASAETIKPLNGGSVSLGDLAGVAYYTSESKGYRVVVTLARTDAARAVRFETVLASGQSVTLSTPQELGAAAEAVEITRTGDTIAVSRARPAPIREAAALD